jgi:anti-sigma B factor antagonist
MNEVSFPVELVDGAPVVTAPEEVDITNADGLRTALLDAAGRGAAGDGTCVVDMTRTRFCDSAGIHALVEAHKRARAAGGQVLVALSGTTVPRIFEITGVDRAMPRYGSVAEALATLGAAPAPPRGFGALGD